MEISTESDIVDINLQLGDIIEIVSSDESMNNQNFLIEYLDESFIDLINIESLDKRSIIIKEDGSLDDESIASINLLSRSEFEGYAKQNGLLPKTWINIEVEGDLPMILTGEILNLEEDMIEVKTYPDSEMIYIDFEYKGLPKELQIKSITIRDAPSVTKPSSVEEESSTQITTEVQEDDGYGPPGATPPDIEPQIKDIKEIILEGSEFEIGLDLGEITQNVEVEEGKERYGLDIQTNDLLDELLAALPINERNKESINNIHLIIERYIQLRNKFSERDQNDNIVKPIKKTADHKPLLENLLNYDKEIPWLIPVVKFTNYVYDICGGECDELNEIQSVSTLEKLVKLTTELENYYNNDIPDEENGYRYLLKTIYNNSVPFLPPQDEDNIINIKQIMTQLSVIVNNDNNYNSVAISDNQLARKKYMTQRLNNGLTQLESYLDSNKIEQFKRVLTTEADKVYLYSYLMLPEYVVRYSRIGLKSSDILLKSNLNHIPLYKFLLLNKKVIPETITVDKQLEYDDTFLMNVKELIPNEINYEDENFHKDYLNSIVPKTRTLFKLVQKYLVNKFTLYHVLKELSVFNISVDDITYKQYQEINGFINSKILGYKKQLVEKGRDYNYLLNRRKDKSDYNPIYNILNQYIHPTTNEELTSKVLLELYSIYIRELKQGYTTESIPLYTSSEILRELLQTDFGNLFFTSIALINLSLTQSIDINETIERYKLEIQKPKIDEAKTNTKCVTYILTKRYTDLDELLEDNNTDVYYDKNLDPTRYDIIENYKDEQASMKPAAFKEFLINELQNNIGLTLTEANRDAIAMIAEKRLIVDGEYASLLNDITNDIYYYKRVGNSWDRDESINQIHFKNNKSFCLQQTECVPVNDICADNDLGHLLFQQKTLDDMTTAFDIKYEVSKEELTGILNKKYDHYSSIIKKLQAINNKKKYKYDLNKLNITNINEINIVESPYAIVRDIILGQYDIVKKNNDIITFCSKFTREAKEDENRYWKYCIETSTKLIPLFLYTLAIQFIKNDPIQYNNTLDTICAEQGTISDDNESWVDKYSGYVIREIQFDTEEGYEASGFKKVTREVLEQELVTGSQNDIVKKYGDSNAEIINNIINAMETYMGITVGSYKEDIIRNTLLFITKVMLSKSDYEKKQAELKKKSKKIPDYETALNTYLLLGTLSYLTTYVVVAIPSIKTKKQFPGCVKNFTGYPLTSDIDISGLLYISCVANKIKSSVKPWNTLKKMNETSIAKRIKDIINKYIIVDKNIQSCINKKLEYNKLEQTEEIPIEIDVSNWNTFLPPIINYKISELESLSDSFKSTFLGNCKSGNKNQYNNILVIRSKIIHFSLAIFAEIQKIIVKKTPLLSNNAEEPFLENSCCIDNQQYTTIQYFMNESSIIEKYHDIIKNLNTINKDYKLISVCSKFYSTENTRRIYPSIFNKFSEKTIYMAFIHFCKFDSLMPIPDNLKELCSTKPTVFNPYDSIDNQIKLLKDQGKEFTPTLFNKLYDIITNDNMKPLEIPSSINTILTFDNYLKFIKDLQDPMIPNELIELFENLVPHHNKTITKDTQELKDIINYLSDKNESLRDIISSFIQRYSNLSKSKLSTFNDFLNTFMDWNNVYDDDDSDNLIFKVDIQNESLIRKIGFIKNMIESMVSSFPYIILNSVDYKNQKIPSHWKLSDRHNKDIMVIIGKYYELFIKYYDNTKIISLLSKINNHTQNLLQIIKLFPSTNYSINSKGELLYTVFNNELFSLFLEYSVLSCYKLYISLIEESVALPEIGAEQTMAPTVVGIEEDLADIEEMDIISGDHIKLNEYISSILVDYTSIFSSSKKTLNYSKQDLNKRINITKEKEKDLVTTRLKDLSKDERSVDTMLKKYKLGDWSKGLQKGTTQYVQDTYDEEREIMEKQIALEQKLGQNDKVTAMNRDIYMADLETEQRVADAIEHEEMSLAHLGDDDDFGDLDGDEFY